MDNSGLSASDVALMNGNGMNGLGSFGGIIGLLAVLGIIGNGGLFGNNQNLATQNDVQRGFDNIGLQDQSRDILNAVSNGTAQEVAATNQTFHDSLMANQNLYNELSKDIAALQVGQANALANQNACCCETKQLIMQNNYDAAMRDANTNANFTAQIQSVKDMISQNKIDSLQNRVNQLELQNAVAGVVRYPTSTSYSVPSPCFGAIGCNSI